MKWVEIIRLRSTNHLKKSSVKESVIELLKEIEKDEPVPGFVNLKLYHHTTVESDLSIHMYWDSEPARQGKSSLGVKLAHVLSDFGLLNYSVWIEDIGVRMQRQKDQPFNNVIKKNDRLNSYEEGEQ